MALANNDPRFLFMSPGQRASMQLMETAKQKKAREEREYQDMVKTGEERIRGLLGERPEYKSITEQDEYKRLAEQAYGTGDMPEYALLKQQAEEAAAQGKTKLAQQLQDEMGNLALSQAGSQANAYSQLAQGGGLSSGSRERIAAGGLEQQMKAQQAARLQNQRAIGDVESQLRSGLLDIGAKGAAARTGLQTSLLGTRQTDLSGQNVAAQDQWKTKAEVESSLLKARQEEQVAKKNEKKGKIICTKLNAMGLLDDDIFHADQAFGRWVLNTHPRVMFGYLAWASYIIRLIEMFPIIAHIIAPPVRAWANQMAYEYNGSGKPSLVGKIIMKTGWAFSGLVGQFVYRRKSCRYQ